jgi:hypothetical protein
MQWTKQVTPEISKESNYMSKKTAHIGKNQNDSFFKDSTREIPIK